MRIAVVTDGNGGVSRHYGRAPEFLVLTVEDGVIIARETRPKAPCHGEGGGGAAAAETVSDCDVVIAAGMGTGALGHLDAAGLTVVTTDETDPETAALRCAYGDLPHLANRIHRSGRH